MKKNIGTIDKIARLMMAIAVGVLYYMGAIEGTVAIVLGVMAAVLVMTVAMGSCALYSMLGLSSCKACKKG